MAMWSRFDAGEIDEDFARIAAAGLDAVRFFLLWEAFQPEINRIDSAACDKLERVLELLRKHGLRGMPTFFTGHMSGVNWLPAWVLDPFRRHGRFRSITDGHFSPFGAANVYQPGPILAAQRLQVRTIGSRFAHHPAIEAWDLGNEFTNVREPSSVSEAGMWSGILTLDLVQNSFLPVTGGIHGEDLDHDGNIRPSKVCSPWLFATMHGYPVYSAFARDRKDPEVVPFLAELTASFSGKDVLFSEFGNPSCPPGGGAADAQSAYACLDDEEMAEYCYGVLDRLQRRGALGAYWWCYTDYDPALSGTPPFDYAPHELRFGAWRSDGQPKPVVDALTRFAREQRKTVPRGPAFMNESDYFAPPMDVAAVYARYLNERT